MSPPSLIDELQTFNTVVHPQELASNRSGVQFNPTQDALPHSASFAGSQ
jgi:hypothetical protein